MGRSPTIINQSAPAAPQAAPTPVAPPVTSTQAEVVQAALDVRQQEMLKKNVKSTIRAGDTGGWRPNAGKMPKMNPLGGNPLVPPQGKV